MSPPPAHSPDSGSGPRYKTPPSRIDEPPNWPEFKAFRPEARRRATIVGVDAEARLLVLKSDGGRLTLRIGGPADRLRRTLRAACACPSALVRLIDSFVLGIPVRGGYALFRAIEVFDRPWIERKIDAHSTGRWGTMRRTPRCVAHE